MYVYLSRVFLTLAFKLNKKAICNHGLGRMTWANMC